MCSPICLMPQSQIDTIMNVDEELIFPLVDFKIPNQRSMIFFRARIGRIRCDYSQTQHHQRRRWKKSCSLTTITVMMLLPTSFRLTKRVFRHRSQTMSRTESMKVQKWRQGKAVLLLISTDAALIGLACCYLKILVGD